jgi:hypothetical protein
MVLFGYKHCHYRGMLGSCMNALPNKVPLNYLEQMILESNHIVI